MYISFLTLTCVIELLVERGYFIQIGQQQIAYRTICETVTFLLSLCLLRRCGRINRKLFNTFGVCFITLFAGWLLLIIFPTNATGGTLEISWDNILMNQLSRPLIRFNGQMIIEIIQIIMFLVILITSVTNLSKEDFKTLLNKICKYSFAIICIGLIEVVTVYVLNSGIFYTIVDAVLGKSIATVLDIRARAGGYAMCGLTKESSHYVFSLGILLIMFFSCNNLNAENTHVRKRNMMAIVIIAFISAVSFSFSAVYIYACLFLLFLAINYEKKGHSSIRLLIIIAVAVLILCLILNNLTSIANILGLNSFLGRRFASVVEELDLIFNSSWLYANTALEWSNRVRLGSTYETLKLILYRPILGLGLSACAAHSSLAMLISGSGILGSFMYLKNMFGWVADKIKYNKNLFLTCIIIYLSLNLFNSLGLRPFYETWTIVIGYCYGVLSCTKEGD